MDSSDAPPIPLLPPRDPSPSPPSPSPNVSVARPPTTTGALAPLVDAVVEVIERRLTRRADVRAATAVLAEVRGEACKVDAFLADPNVADPPAAGLLRAVCDPRLLLEALSVRERSVPTGLYFLPILVTWGYLAFVEHRFEQSGRAEEQAFFSWWAAQSLGPSALSALLAAVVAVIVVLEIVTRSRHNGCLKAEEAYTATVHALATRAATTVDLLDQRTRSGQPLAAMERIAVAFERGGSSAEVIAASVSLSRTMSELTPQLAAIERASSALSSMAHDLPERVVGWTAELDALVGLPEAVRHATAETRAAAEAFARGSAELVSRLPEVAGVLERSHRLSEELVASEAAVAAAMAGVRESYEATQTERERHVGELRAIVRSLEPVLAELTAAAVEVRRAVALADALETLGEE